MCSLEVFVEAEDPKAFGPDSCGHCPKAAAVLTLRVTWLDEPPRPPKGASTS